MHLNNISKLVQVFDKVSEQNNIKVDYTEDKKLDKEK